jgi:hypothetical protein
LNFVSAHRAARRPPTQKNTTTELTLLRFEIGGQLAGAALKLNDGFEKLVHP